MNALFGDTKTDEEKAAFFLSGRGYETGVIAHSIQNDVAMAYHRCAEYKKELAALQAECDRLTRYYKNGIECFANPCERHSGERTPPFSEFFEKYGGQCLICVVDNNKRLQAQHERLMAAEIQKRFDGNEVSSREHREELAAKDARIAELHDEITQLQTALTIKNGTIAQLKARNAQLEDRNAALAVQVEALSQLAAIQGGMGEEPLVVATAILGGLFHGGSGPELGDIDVEVCTPHLEKIQRETVDSSDDVFIPLMTVAQHQRILAAQQRTQAAGVPEDARMRAAAEMYRLGYGYHESHAESILIAAAPQAEPDSDWIACSERKPPSGQTVLAFYLNAYGMWRRIRAQHVDAWTIQVDDLSDPDTECVEYSEQEDAYYLLAGWYECIDNWDDYSRIAVNEGIVTHWMPLPAAPTLLAGQPGGDS